MKTKYKYIEFREWSGYAAGGRKTSTWDCINRKHNALLGFIKWYGPWRQYCFMPCPDTVFSGGCLTDIDDFLTQLKAGRNKG